MIAAILYLTAINPLYPSSSGNETGTAVEKRIARGKQLVAEGNCDYCHTPLVETKEGPAPDMNRRLSGRPLAGEIPRIPDADIGSPEWRSEERRVGKECRL